MKPSLSPPPQDPTVSRPEGSGVVALHESEAVLKVTEASPALGGAMLREAEVEIKPVSLVMPKKYGEIISMEKTLDARRQIGSTLETEISQTNPVHVDDKYGGSVYSIIGTETTKDTLERFAIPEIRQILSVVGTMFEYDDAGNVTNVMFPTPDRLQSSIEANNLPVVLESINGGEYGRINQNHYASVVMKGQHPVGTTKRFYYEHDITNDHMPAVVVCGAELFDLILSRTSNERNVADLYDIITSNITNGLRSLFTGDIERFEQCVETIVPGSLHGYSDGKVLDKGASKRLREIITAGLDRLGIAHPDIQTSMGTQASKA